MSKEWFNNVQLLVFFFKCILCIYSQGKIMILTCKYNLLGSKKWENNGNYCYTI